MLVYRVCSKEEVDLIFSKGIEVVGRTKENINVNSHNYLSNVNYLHFFLYKSDILHINSSRGCFVCIYDIPHRLLDLYCGVGKYSDYIKFIDRTYVIEFAIPSKELKLDYLKRIDLLLRYIDYKDFLEGDLDQSLYETIYDSSNSLIRVRKKEESSS